MDEFWGITILLFIILTIFVAFVVRIMTYYKKYHLERHEKTRLSDRLAELKSGDIILFIGHTHGLTNSLFTSDLFTHSGMVVRDGDQLFLSEATVDSQPDPSTGEEEPMVQASQLSPLLPRLKQYPGMMFLMRLQNPLTEAQKETLLDRADVVTPYPTLFQMLKAICRLNTHTYSRHCMQHVAWLLDELRLTPKPLARTGDTMLEMGFFRTSRAVTTLSGKPLGYDGENMYGPIRELLYDLDVCD